LDASKDVLSEELAEPLVVTAAAHGHDWPEARKIVDLPRAAEVATELTFAAEARYQEYVRRMRDENNDRADLQLAALDRHLRNQTDRLGEVKHMHLAAGRQNLAKATDGHIERLRRSVEMKKLKVARDRTIEARHDEVCVGLVKITS
jgi:hypothetical protein